MKCSKCGSELVTVRPGVHQCENNRCTKYGAGVYDDAEEEAKFQAKKRATMEWRPK